MKNSLSVIFIFIFLLGCSSTKIHLVTEGFTAQEVDQINQQLHKLGYKVEQESIEVPRDFSNSVIAINPSFSKQEMLQNIRQVIKNSGLVIAEERRFGEGRHFYSDGQLGLYLRNPLAPARVHMPLYLKTKKCKQGDATLQFNPNGKLSLETEAHVDGDYQLTQHTGTWTYNGRVLQLKIDDSKAVKFHHVYKSIKTYVGPRYADVFTPMETQTDYPILQCEFLIIYVD